MPPVLIELQYLPPLSAVALMERSGTVLLERFEHYRKGSYRNRCIIYGANGPVALSIPLEQGKHQQLPVTEVRISYQLPWHRLHWQAIRSAYGKAPYFEHYAPELEAIFADPGPLLWDFNLRLLRWALAKTAPEVALNFTDTFNPSSGPEVLDLRHRILPKTRGEEHFGLKFPTYWQSFAEKHGFQPDLSVLDVVMNCGPSNTSLKFEV